MTVLLLIFHVVVIAVALACWRADSRRRIVLTPFLVYLTLDIAFSWNTWLLFVDVDVKVTPYAIMISLLATLCLCLGYLFTSKYAQDICGYPRASSRLQSFMEKPVLVRLPGISQAVILLVLALLGVLLGTYYYQGYPPTVKAIAKVAVEQEVTEEIHTMVSSGRRDLTKAHVFGGEYRGRGLVRTFMVTLWGYSLVMSLVLATFHRRYCWWLLTLLLFMGTFYYVAGTGERSRFVWAVITGLIGLSYVVRIDVKKSLLLFSILMAFLMMMTLFLKRYQPGESGGETARNVAAAIAHRIAAGNKINNVRIMNFLEDKTLQPTYGRTHLRVFLNVLPGIHQEPLEYRLGQILRPGKTTYYNGTYLGTVYIDFGVAGVAVIYFALGVLVMGVSHFLLNLPRDAASVAFISLTIQNLGKMSMGGGIISFASSMVPVVAVYFLVRGLSDCLAHAPVTAESALSWR
jgi:oligosaccharide repeat unit polymerase